MPAELPWVCADGPCYSLACGAQWQTCRQNGKLTESELYAGIASHDYAHPTWPDHPIAAEAATDVGADHDDGAPTPLDFLLLALSWIAGSALLFCAGVALYYGIVFAFPAAGINTGPVPVAQPARVMT